jgi:hypothetical protein
VWIVPRDAPDCAVLMASHGVGTGALQRRAAVTRGPRGAARLGAPVRLAVRTAGDAAGAASAGAHALPAELWEGPAQLHSFLQVPIGTSNGPSGALLVAKRDASASFEDSW